MYHISPHRGDDKQWACMHREDLKYYFNGSNSIRILSPNNSPRIGFGNTPEEAFTQAILIKKL